MPTEAVNDNDSDSDDGKNITHKGDDDNKDDRVDKGDDRDNSQFQSILCGKFGGLSLTKAL